jgi:hypothetical protein
MNEFKYKVGDKLVCIKEHNYESSYGTHKHLKGNIYEVLNLRKIDKLIYIKTEEKYAKFPFSEGIWFTLGGKNFSARKKVSEYFISIAEWRDKQINSILDD